MNVGSSDCSSVDFSDEEQNLIFTWITDLEGDDAASENATDYVYRKLRDYGFCRTQEQVSKYLQDNGFIEQASSSVSPFESSNSSVQSSPTATKKQQTELPSSSSSSSPEHQVQDKEKDDSDEEETDTADGDNLIALLANKFKAEGMEPQLRWLQRQLLEAAYVKLVLEDSSLRAHVEEPVAKFHASKKSFLYMLTVLQ
ncbi:hypothetical protein EGW08_002038 [Elysia chlorotica]|uniref:Uncharacterized protein n=1 Tax=Elysia chlorotica TaxID=188477 RepID=A0A3S1CE25_ELYCH|nr:hypothetical protein EGW08_002038 [Elysia chlorotica]